MADPRSVLVVEDDDAVRLSLRDFLQGEGFTVLVASEGVGAIKVLLDNEVSLVVTDYRMEPLGGDYWIRFLERFCPGMPVIVISGYLDPPARLPFPVVSKPFDYGDMAKRIIELLGE